MNTQYWIDVPRQNEVARSFEEAKESVGLVVSNDWPVCWLSGPGGTGKTFITKAAVEKWEAKGIAPIYANPANARELLAALKSAKGKRPVIMEEADTVFRSDKCLNIMKIATDRKGTGIYDGVNVRVPMIVCTNAPLHDLTIWKKELRPHIEALFNRIPPVTISYDRRANWEYACYNALTTTMLRWTPKGRSISKAVVVKALEWFTLNLNGIELPTSRTLGNVAEWMTILSPQALETKLAGTLLPRSKWTAIPVPRVVWEVIVDEVIAMRSAVRRGLPPPSFAPAPIKYHPPSATI